MRAIGYFRSSADGDSLQHMEEAFYEYCRLNLHQPVETFGDSNAHGPGRFPQYQRMLEYMRESGSNFLVVVPDASHLGHDLESVARSVVELEGMGAKVTCADEELPDPLQNAFQALGVKGVSRTRSDRIKQSLRARALEGKGLGKPPYGYRNGPDGKLEVVPEEAPAVELIYRLFTKDDLGLRLIAQELNGRRIPTRRGGNWNMVTIRDILKNPTHMGTYTRFGLRRPRSHQAIIPPEVFRAAQDKTRARRPVGRVVNAEPFVLSGLVYCSYCGNKMMGVTRRQTWRRKNGGRSTGVYRYYQCQSRNNQSVCEYHTWRASRLEGAVLTQLRYVLRAAAASGGEGVTTGRKEQVQAMRETRVKHAERRLLQAIKRASRGEMPIGMLSQYLAELDDVRAATEKAENIADVDATLDNWDSLAIRDRQGFLAEHVSRIEVKDDAIEVIV